MVFLDNYKYLPFIAMVYVLALMAVWGLDMLSFRSMGLAGIIVSLAGTFMSFAALEYMRKYFGDSSYLVLGLLLLVAYFVAMAAFSFAISPVALVAAVFMLVPPLGMLVKATSGGENPSSMQAAQAEGAKPPEGNPSQ